MFHSSIVEFGAIKSNAQVFLFLKKKKALVLHLLMLLTSPETPIANVQLLLETPKFHTLFLLSDLSH